MALIETLVIGVLVFLAAAYLVRHVMGKGKSAGCGDGCGCCGSKCEKPTQILDKRPEKGE
ncbi:FeoB-associated Cys-rich membrane protein [Desulfobotulus sp.]|uniref:FeoB-associated Cys-rich membrane protein n=1 Tax=Desulfobotulus sp. TaxID=1940337 RepID=UPI002A360952|nr:FeoB-associated Cys-rich membrane protein [Desulfobotulus sp.]MDY0162362.1 FeoB-associated Cys-rich membrane protein [Desulfobotulus sp.]